MLEITYDVLANTLRESNMANTQKSGQITLILTSSPSCLNLFPMITVLVR